MRNFNKYEFKSILIILTLLFAVTDYNISISLRRGRDSIRKNDMSSIQKSLDTFHQKYRRYPTSNEKGEIVGCFNEDVSQDPLTGVILNAIPCIWGESKFENVNLMPRDPKYQNGASYRYVSDTSFYELYISLEGKDEAEYTKTVEDQNLQCGSKVCNYKRSNL